MIYKVVAINLKNEILEMPLSNPWRSGINVKNVEGISPIGADIYSTPYGVIDGGVFSGARVPSRTITLTLGMMFHPTVEDARLILYNFFRIKDPVQLWFLTDNRYIGITGYIEDNSVDIFSEKETAVVTVRCIDPWFYSGVKKGTGFHGVRRLFSFPFSNDSLEEKLIRFGEISIDTRYMVFYEGDIAVGFKMNITFKTTALHNIYLYNMDTRERMNIYTDQVEALTGTPLGPDDEIVISTRSGDKSAYLIRNGLATNALSIVGKTSDWFKLTKGNNVFAFASDYGAENIDIDVTYEDAYAGI